MNRHLLPSWNKRPLLNIKNNISNPSSLFDNTVARPKKQEGHEDIERW
jgi:hypothetical protein